MDFLKKMARACARAPKFLWDGKSVLRAREENFGCARPPARTLSKFENWAFFEKYHFFKILESKSAARARASARAKNFAQYPETCARTISTPIFSFQFQKIGDLMGGSLGSTILYCLWFWACWSQETAEFWIIWSKTHSPPPRFSYQKTTTSKNDCYLPGMFLKNTLVDWKKITLIPPLFTDPPPWKIIILDQFEFFSFWRHFEKFWKISTIFSQEIIVQISRARKYTMISWENFEEIFQNGAKMKKIQIGLKLWIFIIFCRDRVYGY